MTSLKNLLVAGTTLAGLMVSGAAHADIITQTVTVGGGRDSLTTDLTNNAFSSVINQFNAVALAASNPGFSVTLNDVRLTFNSIISTGGTLQNQSATAQSFSFGLQLSSYVAANNGGGATAAQTIVINNFGRNTSGATNAVFGTQDYDNVAVNGVVNYPNANGTRATLSATPSTVTLTDNASLSAFTGADNFGLGMTTRSFQSTSGGGGNVAINLDTRAGGSFNVVYDYTLTAIPPATTVPEPTTLALLGAGLVGAGVVRRRRSI